MDHGYCTKEWELGQSDPRQDVLSTTIGETTVRIRLIRTKHLVTHTLLSYSIRGFILARGLPLPSVSQSRRVQIHLRNFILARQRGQPTTFSIDLPGVMTFYVGGIWDSYRSTYTTQEGRSEKDDRFGEVPIWSSRCQGLVLVEESIVPIWVGDVSLALSALAQCGTKARRCPIVWVRFGWQ